MKYVACTVRGLPAGTTSRHVVDHFNLPPESQCVVGPVVADPQGGNSLTTLTFRNEKTGLKRSCEDLIRAFNRSNFRGGSSTISVTDDFRGLTPLSGAANAPIHVYFVHGLGGHAFNSWCSSVVNKDIYSLKAWPRDFLPSRLRHENIDARIYTLGYNANSIRSAAPNATITSHANNLLSSLLADRSTEPPREIYFVCHSLGGLIVCEALVMALFEDREYDNKSQHKGLFMRGDECLVKGICFLGTPFHGSGTANSLSPFVKALEEVNFFTAVNATILKSLRENNRESVELRTIVQRFKTIVERRSIRLLIGCEQRPWAGSSLIVTRESAINIFGDIATTFEIDDDHRGIVKYDDSDHGGYRTLENLIVKLIQNRLIPQEPTARPTHEGHPDDPSSAHSNTSSPDPGNQGLFRRGGVGIIQNHIHIHGLRHSQTGHDPPPYDHQGRSTLPENPFRPDRHSQQQPSFEPRPASILYYPQQQQEEEELQPFNPRPASKLRFVDSQPAYHPRPPTGLAFYSEPNVKPTGTQYPGHSNPLRRSQTDFQRAPAPTETEPLNRLKKFDTKFIVDDTGSMNVSIRQSDPEDQSRWDVTVEALGHIAELAARYDEDGIDICFLKDRDLDEERIKSGDRVRQLLAQIDFHNPIHGGGTMFRDRLQDALDPHLENYKNYSSQMFDYRQKSQQGITIRRPEIPKFMNLIVITDGEADDEQDVEKYIISVARWLDDWDAPDAYVGIQLVQVGDDDAASAFLDRLDNQLKYRDPPIRDIVDTVPFNCAVGAEGISFTEVLVNKVLLGGVVKKYDRLDV